MPSSCFRCGCRCPCPSPRAPLAPGPLADAAAFLGAAPTSYRTRGNAFFDMPSSCFRCGCWCPCPSPRAPLAPGPLADAAVFLGAASTSYRTRGNAFRHAQQLLPLRWLVPLSFASCPAGTWTTSRRRCLPWRGLGFVLLSAFSTEMGLLLTPPSASAADSAPRWDSPHRGRVSGDGH